MRLMVLIPLCALALLGGCARYEYDIVEPQPLAQQIGRERAARVEIDPLIYVLRSYENRLVMRIENPTNEPIELLGAQSWVVSPDGQSHPLPGQTIAPGSYIKLILPPMGPPVGRWGPSIGIGVGARVERDDREEPGSEPIAASPPMYLQVEDGSAYYWKWEGETEVRLLLTYRHGEQTFQHRFVFQRRKA